MSMISVRLPDQLLHEIDHYAQSLHLPRAEYIRCALEAMNKQISLKKRSERLKEISLRVRAESMRINEEFNRIEDDPEN